MAMTKMPVLSTRTDLEDMPVLSAKQPGTQKASPAAAPKVGGDISAEAWTRATPAQTKVPQSKKQGSALLTKTENVAVGGSRGGRTVYRNVEMPTLAGRAVKVASSVGKSAASIFSDASRALYEAGQKGRTARDTELQGDIQTRLERAESDLSMMLEDNLKQPGTWTDQEVQSQRYVVEDAQRKVNALRQVSEGQVQQKATQKVNQLVDSLDESAAKDTQEAKRGLGKTGSAVVDIGTAGLQLAADRAVGTAMGIGTMPVVAMRVFGGGTKEARQSGATLGQQLTYGAASAAVSAATEQLSNVVKPFAKAFGAGVTDDVVEAAIGKAVERFAGTPAGKTALEGVLKSGAGFLGEGLEEFAEDVASPILKRMTYDPSAQFDLQEALYDFLIGGAMGSLGGAWEGVTDAGGRYRGYQTRAAEAAVDSAYDTMREKGMFSQEARRAVQDAKDIMPKLDPGGDIAWGRMMEAVAPERQEQFQQAREIADRFGTDLVVDKLGNGAAGEYRNNRITIDPNTQNPVRQVLVHELTHHMESSGLYGDFSQKVLGFVAEDMNVDVEALKESIIREYGRYSVELDADGATRELVAKFAEDKLFRDEASIQRLLRTDRNLFQRIYDWIRDTAAKVRGTSEEQFLIDAQRLYEKALRQAGSQQGAGTAQNTFAGVNARTADLNALATAQELEGQGVDADAIRRQTGWFRGTDGKWRFEIDDSGMQYDRQGFTENPDMLRRRELENKLLYGDMTQDEMNELRSLTAATRGVPGPSKLGDFIRHDALFAAYPELADVNVRFKDLTDGDRGSYDRRTNTITLDQKMKNAPQETIIHEVQHAIQQAEGFTPGASPEYWAQKMKDGLSIHENDQRIKKADAEYKRIFENAPDEFKNKVRELNRAVIAKDYDTVMAIEDELYASKYADLYSELSMADFIRRGDRGEELRPSDLYRNTAGEIEARDAAARRQMTPEQREWKMPTLGDENTVFADGVGSTLYMSMDTDAAETVHQRPYYDQESGDIMLKDADGSWKPRGYFIQEEAKRSAQELGQRSPFSEGFNERIVADQTVLQAVKVQEAEIKVPSVRKRNAYAAMYTARQSVADAGFETGSVSNDWTGLEIQIGKPFYKESATNAAKQENQNSARTLGAAKELMQKAYLIGTSPMEIDSNSNLKKKNNPHRLFQYVFAAPYEMDGPKIAVLRVDVLENEGVPINRAYNLRSIEYKNTPLGWAGGEELRTGVRDRATASEAYTISVADLVKNIKADYVGNHVNISAGTETGQFSMGRSFSELVQNQRDGVELGNDGQVTMGGFYESGEPDIMPKLTGVQEPPAGKEPTVEDLRRQAAGAGPNTVPQKPRQQNKNAMDTLGIHPVDDLADYSNTEYLRGSDEAKKATTKARRQAEARLQPTRSEKKFAKGIAAGDYTVEDIPASMRRATVTELVDYYTAENSFKSVDGVQERGRQIREKTERLAAELFKGEGSFKPISMLKMNERTPERVMRRIFGDRQGEIINENYIYPVQQNEAEKMRFIQRQLDAVRTFEDSQGQRSELTKAERAIVQQIMEDRFVEETVASMEVAQGIRNAAENIRKGEDPIDAGREFSLDAEERALAQQLARWTQNQEWLRSGELDSVKINNAVQKYAEQYDLFYDAVNDFLTAHGYSTIGFIKGYAPHMQGVDTQNKLLSALRSMGVNTDASNLPTSISGLTADYKPGKRWNPFFQSRVGNKTDYDVAKGYESYVSYLGDIFYHTDDIARLRGVSRYLRKTYGPEEIKNAIDHAESLRNTDLNTQTEVLKNAGKITDGTKLTYQDARKLMDEYIDELYGNVTKVTKFGEFVKYIDNYANLLAGKQSMADRGMEYMAGRTSLNAGNKLVAAFGRAQVAGNVSSVLNQSSQLAQIAAEVDGKYIAKAAADLTKATQGKLWNIKEMQLFDQSDLLTGKKGIEYLTADDNKFDRMVSAMFKPADIMDSMVSALAVQSKYNQLVAEGTPSEVAMLEADRWATQIMASRMKGSRPMAFESKNVVNQMLHMFQVEAMNSWEHLSQDLPYKYRNIEKTHGKKAVTRAVATVITKGLVSAFLLNRAAEAVYGGTPAPFDVLGYIANFVSSGFGMTANEGLKRLVNAGWKALFGENLLGDDDDDEKELQPFDWGAAAKDLRYDVYNDIPFVRNAAGLLGLGDQTMPFTNMAEAVKGVGKAMTAEERSAGEIGGSLLELGSTVLPGGRQLQKTAQGVSTMLQGGRTYGYGDKQRMQYPVEQSPGKWAQAVLFGNSGLSETREFYASGDSGLTAKQTQVVQEMAKRGIDRTVAYDLIQKIRKQENTAGELGVITESMLTDREKLRLCYDVVADKDDTWPDKLKKMMDAGLTWSEAAETYLEYLNLRDQEDMKATEQATRFAAWIDQSGVSSKQADIVEDTLKFFTQIPAEADRYTAMTEAGLDPGKAESLTMRISQLRPEAGKETVRDLQRYEVVTSDRSLSEVEQLAALESMMEDTEFEKLETAYAAGVTPGQYVEFKRATDGLSADKINGKTVSGSKKAKVLAAIDAMDITNSQKTALYYAAGYKQSTLDEAPWISGKSMERSREDALKLLQGANSQPQDLTMPRLTDENGEVWNPFAKKSSDITMPRLVK